MRRRGFCPIFCFSIAFVFLFHASPSLGRILGIVLLSVDDAHPADLVIVGAAFLDILRIQILRPIAVRRAEERFPAVAAAALGRTVNLKIVYLVALFLRPGQQDIAARCALRTQVDVCIFNALDDLLLRRGQCICRLLRLCLLLISPNRLLW